MSEKIEKSALRALFWRDEILQVLYWMKGEGLGDTVSATTIQPLIQTNIDNLIYHLEKLCADGYLDKKGGGNRTDTLYELSTFGKKEAGRRFAEAFQGMQKAGHGECGPDCEFCYGPDGVKLDNCVHDCGH
jgi:DNA-binding PadR family transcriptional regulator